MSCYHSWFLVSSHDLCRPTLLQSFQRELSKRTSNMSSIRVAARQLLDQSSATSQADESRVQGRLVDLTTKWDTVCRLSVRKQERLHDARCLVRTLLVLLLLALVMCSMHIWWSNQHRLILNVDCYFIIIFYHYHCYYYCCRYYYYYYFYF